MCISGSDAPEVKLIDLGLADDAHTPALLGQAQVHVWHDSEFAAPEWHRIPTNWDAVECQYASGRIELRLNASAARDAGVEAGDLVTIRETAFSDVTYRIHPVIEHGQDSWTVRLVASAAGPDFWFNAPWTPLENAHSFRLSLTVWPHRGYAADLFSLGMVSLVLLTGKVDQRRYRGWLKALGDLIEPASERLARLTGRMFVAWVALRSRKRPELAGFDEFEREISGTGLAGFFGAELLGLSLRATVRSHGGQTYIRHSGEDAGKAMAHLRGDLDRILQGLRLACDIERGQAAETILRTVADQCSAWFRSLHPPKSVVIPASEAMVTGLALLGVSSEFTGQRPYALGDLVDLQADPNAVVEYLDHLTRRKPEGDRDPGWKYLPLTHRLPIDRAEFELHARFAKSATMGKGMEEWRTRATNLIEAIVGWRNALHQMHEPLITWKSVISIFSDRWTLRHRLAIGMGGWFAPRPAAWVEWPLAASLPDPNQFEARLSTVRSAMRRLDESFEVKDREVRELFERWARDNPDLPRSLERRRAYDLDNWKRIGEKQEVWRRSVSNTLDRVSGYHATCLSRLDPTIRSGKGRMWMGAKIVIPLTDHEVEHLRVDPLAELMKIENAAPPGFLAEASLAVLEF